MIPRMLCLASLALLGACRSALPHQAEMPRAAPLAPAAAPVAPLTPPINVERISEITRVLASDEFQGRSMGSAGEDKTIAYLIEQFRAAGLEPGGENGGWTQAVPLIQTQLQAPVSASIRQGGRTRTLKWPEDIYFSTERAVDSATNANAPMVFVGYGVHAPERGWDDFKDVDLTGKVAVFLVNDPDFEAAPGDPAAGKFGDQTMTYYGRWTYKFDEAARRGAIGALVIHETEGAGYGWNVVESPAGENFNVVLAAGARQPPLLQGWIQEPVAADLLRGAGHELESVKRLARTPDFRPIDLKARFSADASVELSRIMSRNVIGKITGARYPNETVSYGGHWDAYGIGPPDAQGRTIRHGAADDAVGIAAMIEIAHMFSSRPRPERTVVFAAWTAEERGLLGSEYYAQNPLFPHETMAANLTLDTLQWAGAARDVVLIGKGQSELEDYLATAASRQNRYVTVESHPERGLFYRADHFSFAKRGVPVLLIMALAGGNDLVVGGRPAGEKWVSDFTANCYHQPCDMWLPTWNLEGVRQETELMYLIGNRLANSREWPKWKAGSEFAPVREQSRERRTGG